LKIVDDFDPIGREIDRDKPKTPAHAFTRSDRPDAARNILSHDMVRLGETAALFGLPRK